MKPKPWSAQTGELWPPKISGPNWRIGFSKGIFDGGLHDENQWHKVELDRFAYPLFVRVGKTAVGQAVCTGIHIDSGDSDITARQLRAIPMAQIVATIGMHGSALGVKIPSGITSKSKPGPKGHPPEFFEKVALIYRKAVANNANPIRTIATELYASTSTVKRWIDRCRYLGLDLHGDKAGDSPNAPFGSNSNNGAHS